MKNISLENFDPQSNKEPILTSPRSLEACRRQGILPSELIMPTLDEIKVIYGDNKLDRAGLELVAQHHEERRQEKIRVLLEERAQVIEDEKNGIVSFSPRQDSKSKSTMSHMQSRSTHQNGVYTDSTLLDKERRQLERIKQKQEKELKQMLDYELTMAQIKKVQEEKLEKQRQREGQRERELSLKRKEAEEKKLQQEQEKRLKAEEEEERRRQLAAEEYRREQERAEHEKQKERERRLEAKKREEEQKKKHEEFVKQTEQKLLEQQMLIDEKKQYMEERDKIRMQHLQEQQLLQKQEAEERRRYHEEKLKNAKEKNDEIILQKKLEYQERQARNEYRRKQFEKELEYKKMETQMKAQNKAQLIKRVIDENQKLEEKKRHDYYYKKMLAEERKKELDKIAEMERREKIQREREMEMRRKQVKVNMEQRLNERVEGYLHKMAESDEKVMKVQREKEEEMKNRHALEVIRRHDKLENVQRIARMQEYQKEKALEKIQQDTERANQIKQERYQLLETRAQIRREMDESKRSMMSQFEQVKRGKLDPETMSAEFTRSMSLMQSQGQRQNSASHRSGSGPHSSLTFKRGPTSAHSHQRPQFDQKQTSIEGSTDAKETKGIKNQQKEAKKMVENMKIKQNHEMLMLLEEEQNKENEREARLQTVTNPKEREKMEKHFAIERAKAHTRIQQLADEHDEAIRQLMSKYNLKDLY